MSEKQLAVIDERGVYLGMFASSFPIAEGHRRLQAIVECDLPVGEYAWVDDETNPFGGAFWPLKKRPTHKAKV